MKKEGLLFFGLVFAILLMIGVSGDGITGETVTGEVVTGDVSASLGISVTVVGSSTFTIKKPENGTYSHNFSIELEIDDVDDSNDNDNFWYNLDDVANITFALGDDGDGNTDGDEDGAKLFFNATTGSHTINVYSNDSDSTRKNSVTFSIDTDLHGFDFGDFDDEFKGNSTNFFGLSFEQMQNFSDIIFEKIFGGKMHFPDYINITDDEDASDGFVNFTKHINISDNRIELNGTALPNFNTTATLVLYNLDFSNPRVLRDGKICGSDICKKNSYTNNNLSFNVTGFSVYSAEETPADSDDSGGNSGGISRGSGSTTSAGGFKLDISNIGVSLKRGEARVRSILVENTGDGVLNMIVSSDLGDFVTIIDAEFTLDAGEKRTVEVIFAASDDDRVDLYQGGIYISDGSSSRRIRVLLEVESRKPLFDVDIKIPENFLYLSAGDDLISEIDLFNIFDSGNLVDVFLEYEIRDLEGNVILVDAETVAVEERVGFVKTLKIPSDTGKGAYVLYVKASYNGEIASAVAQFSIGDGKFFKKYFYPIMALVTIVLLLLIFYWLIHLHKHIGKYHKKR